MNCVRWVSSCRHTQSRKSCGGTSSSRSTWTMFGATSSSRPPPPAPAGRSRVAGAKVSYWPRTREARKDSSMPSSTPVTLPPTAPRTAPPGELPRRSCIFSSSGRRISRKPATFARTQPGRSTTRTGVSWVSSVPIRVKPRTCSSEALACQAQFRDDGAGLVAADLRARPYEPGRGRHREIPVDHAGCGATDARHVSTVREGSLTGQGVCGRGVEPVPGTRHPAGIRAREVRDGARRGAVGRALSRSRTPPGRSRRGPGPSGP
ncbi:hypothetical protein SGLAM104S_00548 [Streptomyces glaucescens]